MGTLTASLVLPSELKPSSLSLKLQQSSSLICRRPPNKHKPFIPVARLFGPAIFDSSKLKVLFFGVDEKKHPGKLPRTYTLAHCDVTSKLTLTISQTINNSQVIKAFVHGDGSLFNYFPELQESMVWIYFHSNTPEFNKVQCWGPLKNASAPPSSGSHQQEAPSSNYDLPKPCLENCTCCFPPMSLIPWSQDLAGHNHQQKTKDGLMGLYD